MHLPTLSRRDLLALAAALPALALAGRARAAVPFSFEALTSEMRDAAARPYAPAPVPEAWWGALDYDGYRMIRFRDWRARWAEDEDAAWRVGAFHMGWLYPEPVEIFDLAGGSPRPMRFSTEDFDYFGTLAGKVPADGALPGVAGFRLNWPLNRPDFWDEVGWLSSTPSA